MIMPLHYVHGVPYFTKVGEEKKQYPYLTKDIETEVIIIGGGLTGSILAYYFSKLGIPNVVLEKKRVGHGSTSITTALIQFELDSLVAELIPYTTKEKIIWSHQLGIRALNQLQAIIDEYGNQCEYAVRDTLLYTAKKLDAGALKQEYETLKENGFDVEFINKDNNPFLFDIEAGVYANKGGAEINPYLFTLQLLDIAESMKTKVFENSGVEKIEYEEDRVTVETEFHHRVQGKIVIMATGYDTNTFASRKFGTKTVTYNVVTNQLDSLDGWHNLALIRDYCDPYNYYRTTKDKRIIAGGQDLPYEQNINNKQAAEKAYDVVSQNIYRIYPKANDLKIEYKYCGLFTSTQDDVGFIGKDPDHKLFWYCLGYGANGILFSLLGGDMLSRLYLGEVDPGLELFRVDRFDHA